MSSPYLARAGSIIPVVGATDLTAKKGYLVALSQVGTVKTATLSASATVPAAGVVVDGSAVTDSSAIGILGSSIGGNVYMKTSGAIVFGARVIQAADGTIVTDTGPGNARVVVGVACESTVAVGDLIEVAPIAPMILP